ncbi:tRNA threonylcarbamoyladenosine biosynthesis protein TsaE [Pasteurella langaaensis DSM 22999]|uniref:tRNA threonylcarbamoyladenosine biosynthesis protein TsaE n=1 Tax=Alitibacter langaaensis DSM 22999 TaxID=1122935 RepID=A0A2U0T8E6_9PAST|nr:tRNA (adenosine(37)-N6)-threonylcarbamoyltransferase complex ATPase subunit type 1 TsaE [Pasteurella langaaensis]PVX39893.1 tRNA threonylcarbamoyladenosine biosynthesis protein TsaE [Pasteurella langaaensis DSM 22999]
MLAHSYSQFLPDENAMIAFGQRLITAICQLPSATNSKGITLYLNGELGAGKTTLSRGMIQGLGHQGNVKSPTYTLVEEYHLQGKRIYHFDLYRLSDPEELEFMGIRDYFSADSICLIEWAEKGKGLLEEADILVNITYADTARHIELIAQTAQGAQIITQLTS